MSELNARQWDLYNLLKNNPDKTYKQIDICYELREWYQYDAENTSFHDSNARLMITSDIRKINNSKVIQKIIITDRKGVRLASKEEFQKYINGQYAAVFRKLERTRRKAFKGGLDGQMRLTFGSERDTVEAFANGINRLRAARLNSGLKLRDVIERLGHSAPGVDISLLSKIENGHCLPTPELLQKLDEIYNERG